MPPDPPSETGPPAEAERHPADHAAGGNGNSTPIRSSAPRSEELQQEDTAPPESDEEKTARTGDLAALRSPLRVLAVAGLGLFTLAFFYTLYAATTLFLPVVIALVLKTLFRPAVRTLKHVGLPEPVGAAIVVLGLLGAAGYGLYELSGPAGRWVEQAPEQLRAAEQELRGLFESVQSVSESAQAVGKQISGTEGDGAQPVPVEQPSLIDMLLGQTQQFLVGAAVVFFLLYFLLASGDFFLRKLVHVLPLLRRKRAAVQIVHEIEDGLSTYLSTYAIINSVLGAVVGLELYLLGMPNPFLWGVMAALLNFMPYLGAAVGVSVVAVVSFVSIESTGRALAAPLIYFLVNSLEGNLVTPTILGRRLLLNPVAIFLSLTFWGWIWGVAGALLATPLLLSLKVVCDNVVTLRPLGEFLGR